MSKTLNGLLSGKYDSTKQRAVLLNGDRLRNYRSYTATMRLELLLTGHLVFTDAQFFDGLYFHWLAADKEEFEAFQKLMVSYQESKDGNTPLFSIAVKCRGEDEPDLDKFVNGTFFKQFQFSSIEHDDLSKAVFRLGNDYVESYLKKYDEKNWKKIEEILKWGGAEEKCISGFRTRKFELAGATEKIRNFEDKKKTLENYIKDMTEQLRCYAGEASSIVENWEEYIKELKRVFDVKERLNKWGSPGGDGTWISGAYRLNEYIAQSFPDSSGQTYREKMDDLLKQAQNEMENNPVAKRYFCRITDELNRGIGNRSKITTALDELEHLNNQNTEDIEDAKEKSRELVRDCFRDFRQLMNERYNKTLAEQHGCQFLDLCDYKKVFEHINSETTIKPMNIISQEWFNNLANLSWNDFVTQLESCKTDLKTSFDEWMSAYKEYPQYNDIKRVTTCLKNYIKQLSSTIAETTPKASAAPESIAPWDKTGTCDNNIRTTFSKFYRYPYYFIGGGSFEASAEGNEICILCVGQDTSTQKNNMTILRLRFDDDKDDITNDRSLDTLLAPVCNPLNGGALKEDEEK